MTGARTCATCVHAVTETAPDKTLIRFCRRYPPMLTAAAVPTQTLKGTVFALHTNSSFPAVMPEWCCGEWQGVMH
jgi:hypothetical protein